MKKINFETNNYIALGLVSLGAILIPYLEFINYNIESLEPFLFKSLFNIFIFSFVIYFISIGILYFILKFKFVSSIHLSSIIYLIIFSYDKLKSLIYFIFKESDYKFFGEFSLILIILLIISIVIINKKKYFNFFRFINLYIILTLIFSFISFFYKIDLDLITHNKEYQLKIKFF